MLKFSVKVGDWSKFKAVVSKRVNQAYVGAVYNMIPKKFCTKGSCLEIR